MGGGNVTIDNKHAGKKRTPMISVDAGVGGLVVLGGAMAVTVLMVVATTFLGKKNKRKDVNVKKEGKELEYGRSCVEEDERLQDQHSEPIHQDLCCNRCERPKNSKDREVSQFKSGRSMVLDRLTPKSNYQGPTYDHQETFVLSDDSRPETVASGDEIGTLTEDSDQSYFQREKLDHGESRMSEDTSKVKRKETPRAEKEKDASMAQNKVAGNESTETKSALRKRRGTTVKKNELPKEEEFNGCTCRVGGDNATGKKNLNKGATEMSMTESPDSSNNPVGLRIRIFFIMLLSIPVLVLFVTYKFYGSVLPRYSQLY